MIDSLPQQPSPCSTTQEQDREGFSREREPRDLTPPAGGDQPLADFGTEIAAAIQRKGWTLARAAREISRYLPDGEIFNPANLSHYVHGRSFPRRKYRRALVQALGLEPTPPGETGHTSRRRSARRPGVGADAVRVQDRGDGTARVQIDRVVPWPDALRLLEVLTTEPHPMGSLGRGGSGRAMPGDEAAAPH